MLLVVVASAALPITLGLALGHSEAYCLAHNCELPPRPDLGVVAFGFAGGGAPAFGYAACMLSGCWLLVGEIRHRTISMTALVLPRRAQLFATKASTAALVGFLGSLMGVFVGGVGFKLVSGSAGSKVELLDLDFVVLALKAGVVGAILSALGVAIGALVMRVEVAVCVAALWPLALERLVVMLSGDYGRRVEGVLPLANLSRWIGMMSDAEFPWRSSFSLVAASSAICLFGALALLRFRRARLVTV